MFLAAVHGGAGDHPSSKSKVDEIKQALRFACTEAVTSLSNRSSALDAVISSISALENDACLNAGYGSNLTIDGEVECDASVMSDSGGFGSVGAVSGIRNPIQLAQAVLRNSQVPCPLGRIPPLMLVSQGARTFAASNGVPTCDFAALVAPRCISEWEYWKKTLTDSQISTTQNPLDGEKPMQDTVGAISWDSDGKLAAGVSSGGLLLKYPGRIGEAAVFGAGCWSRSDSRIGVACSVSGTGEQIIGAAIARTLSEQLLESYSSRTGFDAENVFEQVLGTHLRRFCGKRQSQVGVIVITKEPGENEDEPAIARLWCAFTTASMAITYASSLGIKPKALILRRPDRNSGSVFITSLSLIR